VNTIYISTFLRPKIAAEKSRSSTSVDARGSHHGRHTFGLVGILLARCSLIVATSTPFSRNLRGNGPIMTVTPGHQCV
jgi:hypothetical protein